MDALKAGLKNEKNKAKAKIKELRITGREQALMRFDAAVVRINDLKDKVNAEIVKLDASGIDTTDAKNFVATAETKLATAQSNIAQASTLLSGSTNQLSAANKTQLQTLAKDTQTLIVDAHQALNDAVNSLKDAVKAQNTTTNQ
jgi:hypothetical protein